MNEEPDGLPEGSNTIPEPSACPRCLGPTPCTCPEIELYVPPDRGV